MPFGVGSLERMVAIRLPIGSASTGRAFPRPDGSAPVGLTVQAVSRNSAAWRQVTQGVSAPLVSVLECAEDIFSKWFKATIKKTLTASEPGKTLTTRRPGALVVGGPRVW